MNWKAIPGWPRYEASSEGVIRNRETGKVIRPRVRRARRRGYLAVDLYGPPLAKGRRNRTTVDIHILVCLAFHGPRPTLDHEAAHWNGVCTDNYSGNLRWATRLENANDKRRHNTILRGEHSGRAKISTAQAIAILPDTRTQTAIAADYGIDRRTVRKIKNGQRWVHLHETEAHLVEQWAEAA
jgi:hypothetical protein